VIQEAIAKSWGSFSKIFATQSEDAEKLDRHQLARAHALERVGSPYEPEFSKLVAFAPASLPLSSGLNEKDGKIAPTPGTTPVLERFAWEDEEGCSNPERSIFFIWRRTRRVRSRLSIL